MAAMGLLLVACAPGCDSGCGASSAPREVARLTGEDAEVFLELSASPKQIVGIRKVIRRSSSVERFSYLDRADAQREFRRLLPNEPEGLATTIRGLPPSFRVTFRGTAGLRKLRKSLRGMAGYDGIVDRSHPAGAEAQTLGKACQALERSQAVDVDAEVFMTLLASPQQEDEVRNRLEQAPEVRRISFLGKEAAYRLFQRLFHDEP